MNSNGNDSVSQLLAWAKAQHNDVTARQPGEDGIWVVFDWTTHTLRARGTAAYVLAAVS